MPADERLEPLMEAYIAAWTAIQTRQDRILDLPPSRRPAATRALERFTLESMDKLDDFTERFLKAEFPGVYREGGQLAARRLGVPYRFDSSDRAAVRKLRDDLFNDLLGKTNYVREDTKRAIRRMLKDELVMGRASGKTVDPMRRDLVKRLKDKGIRGVRYSNGRFVRLDDYAQMALRTKASIANNISGIEFGKRNGVDYWECLDGPLCGLTEHNDSQLANGLILPADEALAYPVAHPACRRLWVARPDLRTADEAAKGEPSTTREQMEDQRAFDEQRERDLRRRTAARRRREELLERRRRLVA